MINLAYQTLCAISTKKISESEVTGETSTPRDISKAEELQALVKVHGARLVLLTLDMLDEASIAVSL